MKRILSRPFCLGIIALAVLLVSGSKGQTRRGYPTPPEAAEREDNPTATPVNRSIHLDRVAIERESKEMAALASSIPGDIEQTKKGLLPGNTFDKLRRIEKLCKQLRGQLRPQ